MAEVPPLSRYSIVFLSGPADAGTRSMLPIAQELNRRDHRVTYVTTQEFAGRDVTCGVDVLVHASCAAAVPSGGPGRCAGPQDPVLVEDTLDCAESIHAAFADDVPDLVLYEDSARITARLLTCRWKRPAAEVFPSFPGDFPAADGAPGSDSPAPAGDCVSGLPAGVRERLFSFVATAANAGLSPDDFCTRPEPLSIALLPKEFQTDGYSFDGRVAFVGPCIPERRMDERWLPPESGLPVVFFALDPELLLESGPEFLRRCVDAFAGKPLHVVLSAGGHADAVREAAAPLPNVEVHEHAPRSVVLRCASAFICHADLNSVMESLYFNTPLVAVPTGERERAVADRMVELGLGVRLTPGAAEPRALVDAAAALVEDRETGRRVREFQRRARRAGGTRRAADEIERYLEWIYQP